MIDLHTHILPFIDDGAEDFDESLMMLEMAKKSGTKILAATPHCNIPGGFKATPEEVKNTFLQLKKEALKREIDIILAGGMEIFGTEDVAEQLCDGELITINNTKYPLVEFDFFEDTDYIFYVLKRIIDKGFTPIIAHPERYECFYENPELLFNLYKIGAVIQINKGSVFGAFGSKAEKVADIILSHRLAVVAASDAHSCQYRTPVMSDLARYLDENYGSGCSPLILEENPKRILSNKDVFWEEPIPFY